jgi:UDP-N-acetylmuramyl pentapeptide phosphotransferase/UDP-N-acetylglucosamine-1-phosphate transferase
LKIAVFIVAIAFSSFLLTYLIKCIALRKKLVSIPNQRSLHVIPTPVGGGLAIVITWYIGITILFFSGIIERGLYVALLSGVLLAIVSFINDVIDLKPSVRLFFHFVTAIIAFILLGGLRKLVIPGIEFNYSFLIYPLAIIGIV